ncbi:MAG: class I SAM-dependent methyltransferase, partial [Parvularcula sp.]|nr:class I SAM-dependent methyltransferase [Parvularcula sp.]
MTSKSDAAIRTSWTDQADQRDSGAESLKEHLLEVHRRNPGFTESCASRCTDGEGKTSYDWLCDAAVGQDTPRILDLACGSGVLLSLLRDRIPDAAALVGIDMSTAELDLARQRLKGRGAVLHEGVAQDLAFAGAASFDTVLCHWALTLMDPVEPVFSEVARILAAGGTFAAVVDGDPAEAPGYEAVNDLVFAHVRAEVPSIGERDLGDPRIRQPRSLGALACSAFPRASVTTQTRVFTLRGGACELAEEAVGFFYAAFVLSPQARTTLID